MSEAEPSGVIDRQIPVDAPPCAVAATLDQAGWGDTVRVEPAGSGCRMVVAARILPGSLARSVERLVVDELCRLRRRAEAAASTDDEDR